MWFDNDGLLERNALRPGLSGDIPDWLDLPDPKGFRPKNRYRTIWISDIHLGTRGCNAALLVDFLRSVECQTLYLVGDIVDGWRLSKGWYWPDEHNEVIRRLLKMAHRGTRVVFVVGNHDEMLRDYAGLTFGGVELVLDPFGLHNDMRLGPGRLPRQLRGHECDLYYARRGPRALSSTSLLLLWLPLGPA